MLTTRQVCTWKPVTPDVWWKPSKMLLSSGKLPSLPRVVEGVSMTLLQAASTQMLSRSMHACVHAGGTVDAKSDFHGLHMNIT